jgi:hypothetical protein
VFTRPDDLPEAVLAGALRDGWGFTPASLEYQAVGFGSHHWLATDARGGRVFATVDDLTARLRTRQDTADAAFGRPAAPRHCTVVARRGGPGVLALPLFRIGRAGRGEAVWPLPGGLPVSHRHPVSAGNEFPPE